MYLLIDNYDSFTYNLVQCLGEIGAECEVHRNDRITVEQALSKPFEGIILSPGPGDPPKAGICVGLVQAAAERNIPVFGVCLGLQSIGAAFGAQIVRAPVPMHGKTSPIHHGGKGLFFDVPEPIEVVRYHSLVVDAATLPECFDVTASCDDGRIVMAMDHKTKPLYGVQFHPESIATQGGYQILRNFVGRTRNG